LQARPGQPYSPTSILYADFRFAPSAEFANCCCKGVAAYRFHQTLIKPLVS
jgi:hypothetical protein